MRRRVPVVSNDVERCRGTNSRNQGDVMGSVVMHNVVSVDGYIANQADDVGPLFE
jgi:hypothetical protein